MILVTNLHQRKLKAEIDSSLSIIHVSISHESAGGLCFIRLESKDTVNSLANLTPNCVTASTAGFRCATAWNRTKQKKLKEKTVSKYRKSNKKKKKIKKNICTKQSEIQNKKTNFRKKKEKVMACCPNPP